MGRPRKKVRGRRPKLPAHEQSLLHTLMVCASLDKLDSFTQNLEKLNNGFEYADTLLRDENLTIYSAFPWNQTEASYQWANVRDEINASKDNHEECMEYGYDD